MSCYHIYQTDSEYVFYPWNMAKDKFNIELNEINLGGGLGITYTHDDNPPSVYEIASVIVESINKNCERLNLIKPTLYIEPGRSLVCRAGVSLYTIGSSKKIEGIRKYIAVDGGMADNPRPSMYEAKYSAQIANAKLENKPELVTVAGKFCESGDILIKDVCFDGIGCTISTASTSIMTELMVDKTVEEAEEIIKKSGN